MSKKALLSLLLLVPAASFGVVMALWIFPGSFGKTIFSLSKLWLFLLPGLWYFRVEKGKLTFQRPQASELLLGFGLGMAMLVVILGVYFGLGQSLIDPAEVRAKVQQIGVSSPQIYLAGAAYFTLINAPIEEYVWRWFVGRQCEALMPWRGAIFVSALLFTLHHILALAAYLDWQSVCIGSAGVFIAGAIWSWCYFKFRSLWASTISHIFADFAIAIVGWQILFG